MAAAVAEITRGCGVDVVLDLIGGAGASRPLPDAGAARAPRNFWAFSAAPGERRSVLRAFRAWMATPRFNAMSLINRNRGVFGLHLGHPWDERAQLAPIVDLLMHELSGGAVAGGRAHLFHWSARPKAHRFIQRRQNIGKVVPTP